MLDDPNDSLDDLLGPRTGAPRAPVTPPATYVAKDFTEKCAKCHGTGHFMRGGRSFGRCFTCQGKGTKSFKSSPESRASNKTARVAAKARTQQENIEAFKTAHPAEWEWLNTADFSFAASLKQGLLRYGSLTEGQMAAVGKAIAKRDAGRTAAAERAESAPAINAAGVDRLTAAFDAARAYAASKARGLTIRNPRITIGGIVILPAKAGSKNAGALYVKQGRGFGAPYLGKIAGGKFFASRECSPETQARVLAFIADPKAAAKAYGQETGVCCVCDATLTSEWRLQGIGPICATKFGW